MPDVGPGPSEDLLAELEQEGPSEVWGHLGAHQVCEVPGFADEVSLRWRLHYHHHPHLHLNTSFQSHLENNEQDYLAIIKLAD